MGREKQQKKLSSRPPLRLFISPYGKKQAPTCYAHAVRWKTVSYFVLPLFSPVCCFHTTRIERKKSRSICDGKWGGREGKNTRRKRIPVGKSLFSPHSRPFLSLSRFPLPHERLEDAHSKAWASLRALTSSLSYLRAFLLPFGPHLLFFAACLVCYAQKTVWIETTTTAAGMRGALKAPILGWRSVFHLKNCTVSLYIILITFVFRISWSPFEGEDYPRAIPVRDPFCPVRSKEWWSWNNSTLERITTVSGRPRDGNKPGWICQWTWRVIYYLCIGFSR